MTETDSGQRAVVSLAGVDKSFGVRGEVLTAALAGIDLEIRGGEFVSLIGPSGCGKSKIGRAHV